MVPELIAAAGQVLGSMMGGSDSRPSGPNVSGAPLVQAFHADGWTVATGYATSKGGTTGDKGMSASGGADASGSNAMMDYGGIMPLALTLAAALIGVAILRGKR